MKDARNKLINLLQKAYSGEMAAALAYNGHWKSLKNNAEIRSVRKIERDEWRHRARIREILFELKAEPLFSREILFYLIGRIVGFICHFCGNFLASFFAAMVENQNVREYALASEYAEKIGLEEFLDDFIEMEKTESEHELILREMIKDYRIFPVFAFIFRWGNSADFILKKQNARF